MTSLDSRSVHVSSSQGYPAAPRAQARVVRRIASCSADTRKRIVVPRRRVVFSKEVETHDVISRGDISEDDLKIIWYWKEDFKDMKKRYIPTLKKMAKGIPLGEDDEEPRGLEHKTPQGNKRRHKNRYTAMDAVLVEQDRQWERNRLDTNFLSQMYIQSSAHCRLQASLIAKNDEEYVKEHVRGSPSSSEAGEGLRSGKHDSRTQVPMIPARIDRRPCSITTGLQSPQVLSAAA